MPPNAMHWAARATLTGAAKASRALRGQAGAARRSLQSDSAPVLRAGDALVWPEAISQAEHDRLVAELATSDDRHTARWRRRRYQTDHWDSAIAGFKELERPLEAWSAENRETLERLQERVLDHLRTHIGMPDATEWLPPHVIDLSPDGRILPHMDSVKFSGEVVAGLSMLSGRTMRLRAAQERHEDYRDDDPVLAELHLPPRSLYVLCGAARFACAHEVDAPEPPARRLSVIFRDALPSS